MRILWVATKAPWPPVDGGRRLTLETLAALAAAGHELTLAAPLAVGGVPRRETAAALQDICRPHLVERAPLHPFSGAARALLGEPLAIARHRHPPLAALVDRLLARERFDLVQAEQLQALAACASAARHGVPVSLRCQNVESDLVAARAALAGRATGWWLRCEARRLARWEGRAVAAAGAAIALTAPDARRLGELAGRPPLPVVPPPFPETLPGAVAGFTGDPPLVLFGSAGWFPNEDAASWFVAAAWPAVRARLPGARLHLVGGVMPRPIAAGSPGVEVHPAPADSADAFDPGSLMIVPLRVASGVRIRVLEAWARGVAVVATPEAAAGLDAQHGRELLVASSGEQFADAVALLHGDQASRARVVAAGRLKLARDFDPARVAARLGLIYAGLVGRDGPSG